MLKFCRIFFVFFFVFVSLCFLTAFYVFASISFEISNTINQSDEIEFDITISGLTSQSCSEGRCYFQGCFQKSAGSNYFGYTQNNSGSWNEYMSSADTDFMKANFFYFEPKEGTWSGKLKVKNDYESSAYDGPGDYLLKVMRYSGNSKSSSGESNSLAVNLEYVVETPTPTTTGEPTKSPTPTPTFSPTPTPTKTATPTPRKTSTISPTSTSESVQEVLGIEDGEATPTSDEQTEETANKPKSVLAIVFIILGVLFVGFSIFAFIKQKGLNKKNGENQEIV